MRVLYFGRAFMVNNDPKPAADLIKKTMKIYPYTSGGYGTSIAQALTGEVMLAKDSPVPPTKFIEVSGKSFNTIPPSDYTFYEVINKLVQEEPLGTLDPELMGQIAAIGIVKGKPFNPDARMKKILTDAANVGNATARMLNFSPRESEGINYYEGSQWTNMLFVGGYLFETPPPMLTKDGFKPFPPTGARTLNSRTLFFNGYTGITPAMCMRLTRVGSQYLLATKDANAKGRHSVQYFEIMGNRGIYEDGWLAAARFEIPWEIAGKSIDQLANAKWELYHVAEDFSEANDLAESKPEKLKELQDAFMVEAKKYNVLPLDGRMSERLDPKLRAAGPPKTEWTYYGNNVQLPEPVGPQLFPRSFSLVAQLTIPEKGAEGVIACAGAFSAGWTLYIMNNKPVFHYTCFDIADLTIPGTISIPVGDVGLKTEFISDGKPEGRGTLKIYVNDKLAGEGKLTRTLFRHGLEPFDVGQGSDTPVDPVYKSQGEFPFTDSIYKITFTITQ